MVLPALLIAFVVVSALFLNWFWSLSKSAIWKAALLLSLGIAAIRLFSSLAGQLILSKESGWLQIPAFALALASLPEAALVDRVQSSSSTSFLVLGALILLGTSIWIFSIAAVAYKRKR